MTAHFTPIRPNYSTDRPAQFAGSALGSASQPQVNGLCRVSYDLYLGDYGAYCANIILQNCNRDLSLLEQFFGITPPQGTLFDIFLAATNDGASHPSCISTQITVGALTDPNGNAPLVRALAIAETAEVFMAARNNGWNCEFSHGEGLSRVMAEEICPGAIPNWLCCAPIWLTSDRQDFVDNTFPSDTQLEPVGCAVLFLYWLHYQRQFSWQQVIAAGGSTLGQTYASLAGDATNGFAEFAQLVNSHFPQGTTSQFDNIFPLAAGTPQAARIISRIAGAAPGPAFFAPAAGATPGHWIPAEESSYSPTPPQEPLPQPATSRTGPASTGGKSRRSRSGKTRRHK